MRPEPARLDAVVLGAVTEGKRIEVSMKPIIAMHRAVFCDNDEPLIIQPAQALDRPSLPVNVADELP